MRRLLPLALLLLAAQAPAQAPKDRYTKAIVDIPMRDGIKLRTHVYSPTDAPGDRPILLQRTPYSIAPYGVGEVPRRLGPSPLFAAAGYVVAYQDVRGCYMSEGDFVDVRPARTDRGGIDESTDTYDTIEWLIKNVRKNSGKVGMWGISYPGFYAAAGLVESHPALKAVSPQAPCIDWYMGDDTHHNGAFFLQQEFNFDITFGVPRPKPTTDRPERFSHGTNDGYAFFLKLGPLENASKNYMKDNHKFWNDVMSHGNYDQFWKNRNLAGRLKGVKPAVLSVGGWFDAENLYGALAAYRAVEKDNPGTDNTLVMGPWSHGGWAGGDGASLGPADFGGPTAPYFREQVEFPFFAHYLDDNSAAKPAEAVVFETGANAWRRHAAWPPKEATPRPIFLEASGGLTVDGPPKAEGTDAFESDPAKPVPYTSKVGVDTPRTYMAEDQRFLIGRDDVLTYQTEPLKTPLTIAGPIVADLTVSTTGTDADWVVKLIDVYPEDGGKTRLAGTRQLVRGDVMRGKFREGFDAPKPFTPDAPTSVKFTLQDTYHTFLPGHRVMVQIQGSWFPLVDRNPQTFVDIYHAKEADFVKATHRVYRGPGKSKIQVLAMPTPNP